MRECIICHQLKDDDDFYIAYKKWHQENNKIISKECKDCIHNSININDYNTYDKYLKELDLPYFEENWNKIKKRYPTATAKGIFSRYNALMQLCSFSTFHYKDNEWIKKQTEEKNKINLKNLDNKN